MRSIGEMARASGLSVSALRFYDGAGVFGPARVDDRTGYRWYAEEQLPAARLIARLRRVGLPLAEIAVVLTAPPPQAHRVLDTHLRRLEDGLADARAELSTVRTLIDHWENPMRPTRLTVPATELAAALDSVRFAAAATEELAGVLLETEGEVLRLVASDRHRMALSQAPVSAQDGPAVRVLAPLAFMDALRPLLTAGTVELELDGQLLTATVGRSQIGGERIDFDFPDYRSILRLQPQHSVSLAAGTLREALRTGASHSGTRATDGVAYEVSVLSLDGAGGLTVVENGAPDGTLRVGVNREFLIEAAEAGPDAQLVLELGGPITPLAIRFPSRPDTWSALMPVALTS
ncbi:MerR family transcriptional regulator [Kitasatospora sp. NPDC002227]|uniref:DNA polymerase III subunit beta family protein n=1 Tax=Kitasatospora sp. NPDC002227 TaxID=3154773 RepID=UPI00332330F0